ncbi:hypothetical protein ACCQ23_21310 [Xanthomonas axonopodis pv. phyllanthi]|uniref:hypothetical protein n=1 Tax=Xanthomonas axonopodis TaxID=53413 RepID=UPI0035562A53
MKEEMRNARTQLHRTHADLAVLLEEFGDDLFARKGWKGDLKGLDAVHYYLVVTHHWTPSQVRGMSTEDMRFALTEEFQAWTPQR